ncbi:MAG: lamin tail domain-containing protein [Candidatus Aegiribacteria sp.]|nr:lamin tail domain-containing protein [Candidatus Aegiribacteria sp.]
MLLNSVLISLVMVVPGDIIISEIMYNPDGPTLGADDQYEWIELCNIGAAALQLDGMMLSDGGNQLFLESYTLESMSRVVVAAAGQSFTEAYGTGIAIVPWDGVWTKLSNSSDTLLLYSSSGQVLDELAYSDTWGLAAGDTTRSEADGRGSSLEKINLWGANTEDNWAPSIDWECPETDPETGDPVCWGTPGRVNSTELIYD